MTMIRIIIASPLLLSADIIGSVTLFNLGAKVAGANYRR